MQEHRTNGHDPPSADLLVFLLIEALAMIDGQRCLIRALCTELVESEADHDRLMRRLAHA